MNFLELRPMVQQHTQSNRMSIIGEGIGKQYSFLIDELIQYLA